MTLPKLNARQKLFVEAYSEPASATYGNATRSAKVAGYQGNDVTLGQTGSKLVRNPHVIPHLEAAKLRHAAQRQKDLKAAEEEFTVLQTLRDFQSMYQEARDRGELGQAIRAKELIGKHLKMFTDRVEVDNAENLSAEELRAEIDELLVELGYK